MTTPKLQPGMMCTRGKGKTLWEIISVNDAAHTVELSALGKGGYTNAHANVDDLTNLQPQRIGTPLFVLLNAQVNAKKAAAHLTNRLRFTDGKSIRLAATEAHRAALLFASHCDAHDAGLEELEITTT